MSFMHISDQFSSLTQAAFNAAFEAGELLKEGYGTDFQISPKILPNDIVTKYDYASEQLILTRLKEQFPSHSFLSEESGEIVSAEGSIRWIIDPLDGTVNFARHVPLFCVSIAACQGEEILCGAIYVPMTQEMYFAERHKGAFLNGKNLGVSATNSLFSSYAATSLSFNLHKDPARSIHMFSRMAHFGFPLRAFGSSALNLAYVAAGRLDAYWSVGGSLNPWDVAAGKLLVEEAGGKVTEYNGDIFSLEKESTILATNGHLHEEFIHHLNNGS